MWSAAAASPSAGCWPRIRACAWSPLTGDVSTGQKVLALAAGNLKRTHLELGGKAPVLVFDDADLESVIAGIRTFGYYNAGQDCTAACRLYVGAGIHDRLVADLTERRRAASRSAPSARRAWRWGP